MQRFLIAFLVVFLTFEIVSQNIRVYFNHWIHKYGKIIIKYVTFQKIIFSTSFKVLSKWVQHVGPTSFSMWIRNVGFVCGPSWIMLYQHFFSQKMLDGSLKRFKHSPNILFLISHVRWWWMRLRALPTCWTNI